MNSLTILGLILVFLGGVGGIILAIGQSQSSATDKQDIINTTKNENVYLKSQLTELQKEREKLSDTLDSRDKRIQEQNENIQTLSNKLVEKSEYIENFVTGGDGYPHLEMQRIRNKTKEGEGFIFTINNTFRFPLYSIKITGYDYDKISNSIYKLNNENKVAVTLEDIAKAKMIEVNVDEISPTQFFRISDIYTYSSVRLLISIHSRNQLVIQKIAIVSTTDFTYGGYILLDRNKKELKRHIYGEPPKEIVKEIFERINSIPNDFDFIQAR